MSEYEIGKEYAEIKREVEILRSAMSEWYEIIEHNLTIGKLEQPKPKPTTQKAG